jgi:hypothetical protein
MFRRLSTEALRSSFLLAITAAAVWGAISLSGRAQVPAAIPAWEYHSVGIEFAMLPAKLTELGNDGWEVVTVLRTDQAVENQQDDGKAHLIVRRIEIIAKRLRSR